MTSAKLRNAAILIRSLDYATARQVLQSVRPETATELTKLAASMGRVSSSEVRQAIADYRALNPGSAPDDQPGVVEERKAVRADAPAAAADDGAPDFPEADYITERPEAAISEAPFEAELLVQTLERERPQVIAAVLAKKSPAEAAEVLQGLCEDLRAVVLQRIANISSVNEGVHCLIADAIQQGMERQRQRQQRRDAGQAAVDAILAAQPAPVGIEETCPPPSDAPSVLQLTFGDLHQLDDASLLTVLNHAEPQVIQVAILDAPVAMATRIRRLSSHTVAERVTKTPLLLGDIEHAQRELAALASRLVESGVILLTTSHRLSAAA